MIYHVLMVMSFDMDNCIWEFDSYEKANAFLHWQWEEYYNEEIRCESHLNEKECFHEPDYARVTWDDGEYTEFILTAGLDKIPDEFESVWERYIS